MSAVGVSGMAISGGSPPKPGTVMSPMVTSSSTMSAGAAGSVTLMLGAVGLPTEKGAMENVSGS